MDWITDMSTYATWGFPVNKIPCDPRDHMLGRTGNRIQGRPEISRRCFQILGEVDLFLSLEGSRASDFLEVGLKRSSLAARIQFFGGHHRCCAHGGLCRGGCFGLLILTRHGFVLSLSVLQSGSEVFGYRPKRCGFSTL